LANHDRYLADYGGLEGMLDMGTLESALSRPKSLVAYAMPEPDVSDLAAMYAVGIAKAHSFADANKRTAWATSQVFLILNGFEMVVPVEEAVRWMLAVADGTMDVRALAANFRSMVVPI